MTGGSVQALLEFTREELERTEKELEEIAMLVEQSRAEVDRMAQRNATINNHLRQLNQNFDTVPRADIKSTYEAAQDAQQRLFTMRGQLEKLQSDQASLDRYGRYLRQVMEVVGEVAPTLGPEESSRNSGAVVSDPVVVRIIDAQESERQHLSKLLHDGPAQSLTNFVLQAEIVQRLFDNNPTQARAELQNLKTAASTTFQRVREFITELRPMMLDDLGFVPTVRRYVKGFEDKSGISTTLTVTGDERRFESHREVLAFRSLQELLANARDHAQCTQIRITVDVDDNGVHVVVEDNGQGFDVDSTLAQEGPKHMGLSALQEKLELMGGRLHIESAVGSGTRAELELPVGAAGPGAM